MAERSASQVLTADIGASPNAQPNAPATSERVSRAQLQAWFELPLMDLLLQAQHTLRAHFPANTVQVSTLLSIKTGNCPEDCGYCSQSGHHNTDLQAEKNRHWAGPCRSQTRQSNRSKSVLHGRSVEASARS